ncbi:MAG: hypothetical protein HQM12_09105 [SAR324 cluster bacterium]|nr:hypothetical protein [SAR324 cluster bacterium]MBF0349935.1 hypothetical protein [SAR324 cluster bacterium]
MNWKDKIPECFGEEDKKFGSSLECLKNASSILPELMEKRVSSAELEKVIRDYLSGELRNRVNSNTVKRHIDEQIQMVRQCFDGWLSYFT